MKKILFVIVIIMLLVINYNNKDYKISRNNINRDFISINNYNKIDKNISKKIKVDSIGRIKIPGLFDEEVFQSSDNSYYLNHNRYNNKDRKGEIFLDYRNKLGDKKLIIYGHSGKEKLPFNRLNDYKNIDFYNKHKYIYFSYGDKIDSYKIFSFYLEKEDYGYLKLKDFNGSYINHLIELKNKSKYKIDIKLDENSNIIILQTCSLIDIGKRHFFLVIGVKE